MRTITFDSVGDFVAAAKKKSGTKVSHKTGEKTFYGTATFEEAAKLAESGWPDGVARLTSIRGTLEKVVGAAVDARRKSLTWDVVGDFVDVGRFLSGEHECCGEFRDEADGTSRSRVIKLVANVSAIGSVQSESIFSAGAAIFAAVDILESLGHRVELWLGSGSTRHKDSKKLQVFVKLKAANQPFDADRVAFFLCSNASLRRMFFSVEQDAGFSPDNTTTAPLVLTDGSIVTPEVKANDADRERRISRVLEVCEKVGLAFTRDELEAITAAA